jgi:NhaP-type Na+/H+ or K+/H+ antiporter
LVVLALALFAYAIADVAGTNGFVAAFVGGMAFGTMEHDNDQGALHFTEQTGTLLSLLVWFAFGAIMLVPGLEGVGWRDVVFAVLALTVVRMVPVALSLLGSGLDGATVAFIGWFGPRGLASIVFGLIAVDGLASSPSEIALAAVTLTVASSVLLHGLSATPLAARYGAYARRLQPGRPEHSRKGPPVGTRAVRTLGRGEGSVLPGER